MSPHYFQWLGVYNHKYNHKGHTIYTVDDTAKPMEEEQLCADQSVIQMINRAYSWDDWKNAPKSPKAPGCEHSSHTVRIQTPARRVISRPLHDTACQPTILYTPTANVIQLRFTAHTNTHTHTYIQNTHPLTAWAILCFTETIFSFRKR